jgi:MFS family permease
VQIRISPLSQLSRDAKLLTAASAIAAVSFYGIYQLLKVLYVLRLGYGSEYVGIFNATSAFTYMIAGLPSGALGSRYGARRMMLLGGIGTVIGMALLPLTASMSSTLRDAWPIFSQVVLIAGWSMFNVNLVPALMASTSESNRNSTFAVSNAIRGLGTFLGTLVGGLLPATFARVLGLTLDIPAPYAAAIWVGAALGVIALVPLGLARPTGSAARVGPSEPRGAFPLLPIALMFGYVYLNHGGWATCQGFCSAYMDTELHMPTATIGIITAAGQFLAILTPLVAPRLAARRGNSWTLQAGSLGLAVSLLPLALIPTWTAAGLGRLGVSVVFGIWMPAIQVLQMELVASQWRSLAYGSTSMAMGMGFGSMSLAGGYIIASSGYETLFLIGAGLCTAAAAWMWGVRKSPAVGVARTESQAQG